MCREVLRRTAANLPWVDCIPQQGLNVYSILQVGLEGVLVVQLLLSVVFLASAVLLVGHHVHPFPACMLHTSTPAARLPCAHQTCGGPADGAAAATHQAV